MVYRFELDNTAKELRKGMLQALVPLCIITALVAWGVTYALFSVIGLEVEWYVYMGVSIVALGALITQAYCTRTDYARDLVTFFTLTEKGLMMENEESVTFIPWKRIRSLRLLPAGLLVGSADGLSTVFALGNMPQEKRQEMLEYAQQQVAAKTETTPIQPPDWAVSDTPLVCEASRASAQQTADEQARIQAPRLAGMRLVVLGIYVLCMGALGMGAATDMPCGILTALLAYCIYSQIRRIFHPGDRRIVNILEKRSTESHVKPGSWLVRNSDGFGAWGITRLSPEEITVRKGKGVLLFCLKNRAVIPVDDTQVFPEWLPSPAQTAGTATSHKILALLAPVVAALLFWGTYSGMNVWIQSAEDECCQSPDCLDE